MKHKKNTSETPATLHQGRAGWVWRCLLMPHLKASNREAAGVVHRRHNGNQVRAVRDVLVVELHSNLIIACRGRRERHSESRWTNRQREPCVVCTGLLGHVGDATGSILAVIKGDLCPARSLHGDGQTAGPRLSRPDTELT